MLLDDSAVILENNGADTQAKDVVGINLYCSLNKHFSLKLRYLLFQRGTQVSVTKNQMHRNFFSLNDYRLTYFTSLRSVRVFWDIKIENRFGFIFQTDFKYSESSLA